MDEGNTYNMTAVGLVRHIKTEFEHFVVVHE